MAKSIEPKLVTIGDYLEQRETNGKFIIPEYQRSYAWDISTCDKLWTDIIDFVEISREESDRKDSYFFGTIILNCSDDNTELRIIDGQQRTTTFMLLLKALLLKINETLVGMVNDSESESLKRGLRERRRTLISILYQVDREEVSDEPDLEKDRKIYNRFDRVINESNQELYGSELGTIMKAATYEEAEQNVFHDSSKRKDNRYTNFFRNFKHFYFNDAINKMDFLNILVKTITDRCQIIEIKSWKLEQAIEMFNSLNSDGMPLNDSDIIYSKMYSSAKEDEKKLLGERWSYLVELTKDLEKEKIVTISGLLNQKMYLYRAMDREILYANGGVNTTTPGLKRYYTINNQKFIKEPIKFCNELIILAEIWNIARDNHVIKVLQNFNDNFKLFLATYFHRFDSYFSFNEDGNLEISEEKKKLLNSNIECMAELFLRLFTILSLVDAGYSSSNFKTFLFEEEIKLADETVPFDEIKRDFDEHIKKTWEAENIKARIEDYSKHDIVYLNEYLFAKENGMTLEIGSDIDIEHIMPQSGRNKVIIQSDAKIEDEAMFDAYINKIGNKILLEYNINRSIGGNEWFRTKISKKVNDKSGYVGSKYPLAQHLVQKYQDSDKPLWTKSDIDTATEEASTRIVNFIFDIQS